MKQYIIISFILLLTVGSLGAENSKKRFNFIPDFAKIQFAGNVGFISVGAGYSFWNDKYNMSFIYGYVPESKGGTEIQSFTNKNTFRLYSLKLNQSVVSFTTGGFVNFETGKNSYLTLPDHYPSDYYETNSFHFGVYAGVKYNKPIEGGFIRQLEYYAEYGTLLKYIYYNFMAKEDRFSNIYSLAVGVNVYF